MQWKVGNRTFITALAAAVLLGFLAFNDLYPVVNSQWAVVLVKAAGSALGLSIYFLRDAVRRMDERLAAHETKNERVVEAKP